MSNIVLNLILSSLGSIYLEEECLTSRFSLFCLPWVEDTWKRNVYHRALALFCLPWVADTWKRNV